MELNREIINKLHQVEPSIWESLHDEQHGIDENAAMWEEHKDRERYRFAKRIGSLPVPVIVYNVKSGCFSTLLRINKIYNAYFSQFDVVASGYSPYWEIEDCLFFYEQDGYKVVEGVDGFCRKKRAYSTGDENIPWHCPAIRQELEMICLNASWLSLAVARNIGGGFMRISEMRNHEEEIKRICANFETAREKFFTGLRNANIDVL